MLPNTWLGFTYLWGGMGMYYLVILLMVSALLAAVLPAGAGSVKIEKVAYFNQPNCYKLANGVAEVIVTTDIGPRVISYKLAGGENILAELGPDVVVKTDLGDWRPWGGHRLWHAPEVAPRTYSPDNSPVVMEIVGADSIRLTQPVEPATGIQKEMLVKLDAKGTRVTITHKLTNKGLWAVELAPWALTIMNGGGTTIIPNEPYIPHGEKLLPARPIVLWHYTDLSDPRWILGEKYIRLRSVKELEEPQKLGVADKQGWAAYLRGKTLFVKRFPYVEGAEYPDYGCNCETYTAGTFIEVETLGPMAKLEPGGSAVHVEHWYLFEGVDVGESEAELDAGVMPLVEKTSGG